MKWLSNLPRFPSKEPLLLGAYAWALTVASPSLQDRVSIAARLLAVLTLLVFVVGWSLLERFPRYADGLAVFAFCGLSVCTLVLLGSARLSIGAATVQLTMGAVVWCLYSISWVRARVLAGQVSTQLGNALEMTPAPADPLTSSLAIGLLGFCSAGMIVLCGTPRTDGHGALIVALVIMGILRLTTTVGVLSSRVGARKEPEARRGNR